MHRVCYKCFEGGKREKPRICLPPIFPPLRYTVQLTVRMKNEAGYREGRRVPP